MTEPSFVEEIDCASFFDHIDDLLDFPTDDVDAGLVTNVNSNNAFPTIWPIQSEPFPSSDSTFSGIANSHISAEISVPYEDIVQLEWISSFVEDSFSNGSLSIMYKDDSAPDEKCTNFTYYQFQTSSPVSVLESSSSSSGEKSAETISPACRGARSKRPRRPIFNPRPATQTPMIPFDPEEDEDEDEAKKKKKINQSSGCVAGIRKCLHCEVTKTPQWRAGPMGPKTLCNACGVRHKSGRLFPEYRPAASPTYVPTLHSNSHKKVIQMRNKAGD